MQDPDASLQRIGELFERAAYRQALRICDQVLTAHPACVEAHDYRGLILCRMGRYREALPSYDRAISLEPDFVPALLDKAELLVYYLGESESAISITDRVLRLATHEGEQAHALYLKGIAYANLDCHEEALVNFDRSIELDPEYPDSHCEKGASLFELYRFSAALSALKAAIALDGAYARPHHFLGIIYEFMGEDQLADREYDLAARLDPEAYPPPLRLSEGDFRRALEEAVHTLPRAVSSLLPDVDVTLERLPSRQDLADALLRPSALVRRVPPSGGRERLRLVVYRRNVERVVRSRAELVEELAHAVAHELGHPEQA